MAPASPLTSGLKKIGMRKFLTLLFRSAVYSCVASAGLTEDYQAMLRLHEQADSHEEKERIARLTLLLIL